MPGARIDWGNTLTRGLVAAWLFNENGGLRAYDLIKNRPGVLTNTPTFGPRGLDFPAAGTAFVDVTETDDTAYTGPLSIFWRGIIRTGANFRHFAGKHAGNGATNCPFDWRTDNSGTPLLVLSLSNAANRQYTGAAVTLNRLRSYAFSKATAIETVPSFFIDGQPTAAPSSVGGATGATTGTNANIRIGRRADGAVQMDGFVEAVYVWSRQLSPSEHLALGTNPFIFIIPSAPRPLYVMPQILNGNFSIPVSWGGETTFGAVVPVSWGGTLDLGATIPVEWLAGVRAFSPVLPIELLAGLSNQGLIPLSWNGTVPFGFIIPIAWQGTTPRAFIVPVEWAGINPDLLLHIWNVLQQLNAPFLHDFDVVQLFNLFPIMHQWSVFEQPTPLIHEWHVTGDIATPFGLDPDTGQPIPPSTPGGLSPGDIQRPVAQKDKTP